MTDTDQKIDDQKGDEVLRRMLKTPSEPRKVPAKPPLGAMSNDTPAATTGRYRGEIKD